MSTNHVNYIETYFEFKELTKIHGEPTYDSIKQLHNELKANARSVCSSLGGGNYGHLGLVLTDAQYGMISNVPFVRPDHPGPLIIPPNITNHMTVTMRDQHRKQV